VSRFGAHSGGFDLPRLRVWTVGIEAFVCAVVIVPCGAAGIRPVHSPAGTSPQGITPEASPSHAALFYLMPIHALKIGALPTRRRFGQTRNCFLSRQKPPDYSRTPPRWLRRKARGGELCGASEPPSTTYPFDSRFRRMAGSALSPYGQNKRAPVQWGPFTRAVRNY
jgi:choline dehydrogenase-like flavoprotein